MICASRHTVPCYVTGHPSCLSICFSKRTFPRLGFRSAPSPKHWCLFCRSRLRCQTIQSTPSTTLAWGSFHPSPASESRGRADLSAARPPCPITSYQTPSVSGSLVSCCHPKSGLSVFHFFSGSFSFAHLFQRHHWTARCPSGHPGVCVWVPAPGVASVTAHVTSCCGQPTLAPPALSWRSRLSARPTAAGRGSNLRAGLLRYSTLGLPVRLRKVAASYVFVAVPPCKFETRCSTCRP